MASEEITETELTTVAEGQLEAQFKMYHDSGKF
jgi:hypothetical protein